MARPPIRQPATRELIQRLQAKRARQRQVKLAAAGLGGIVVLAIVVVAVILAVGEVRDEGPMGAGTTSPGRSGSLPSATTDDITTDGTNLGGPTTTGMVTSLAGAASTIVHVTTTTRPTATSTSAPAASVSTSRPEDPGKVVVIDPGHQAKGDSNPEPVGPSSSEHKAKVTDGTVGVTTGIPESELVLAVSLKLRAALEAHGIETLMTRESEDFNLSNIQRAQIANQAKADLFIRIHADGSNNPSASGIHVLYPTSIKGWTDDIAAASKKAALLAQRELIAATGAIDRGIDARGDMTGFNWADVPVILPEIGFMTNAAEDRLLATDAYRNKIVAGLVRAILTFLGVS